MTKQEAIEYFQNEIQCADTDSIYLAVNQRHIKACEWALVGLQEYNGNYEEWESDYEDF